jgi:prevent-host-death family protein
VTTPAPVLRLPVRRFRANLAWALRRVREGGAYVVLTQHGVPTVAVVPVGALGILDAADRLLSARAVAAGADLHGLAASAADVVAPGTRRGATPPRPVPRSL